MVSGHKLLVNVMINSLANSAALNTQATISTGIGKTGAAGMFSIHHKGAYILA
nr:chemotaxis protein CheB [uncultured Paraglaciecola sp.]